MTDIDDLLRGSLHDDRWALPVPPAALDRVRQGHRARRRRKTAVTATCIVLAGGVAVSASNIGLGDRDRVDQFAASPRGTVTAPIPGISPAFTPATGREWILSLAELDEFIRTHTGPATAAFPYPEPAKDPSITQASLLASIQEAGLPAGTRFMDAPEGNRARIKATLPSGVQVDISRTRASSPFTYAKSTLGQQAPSDDVRPDIQDVPGTTSTVAIDQHALYGFADDAPGAVDTDGDGAPDTSCVTVVNDRGLVTAWCAYASVPLVDLTRWAFSGAQTG